jgi:hypothetical protein
VRQAFRRGKNGFLRAFKDTIETAQHDERQNYLAVFGLLEVAAQDFRNRPNERSK